MAEEEDKTVLQCMIQKKLMANPSFLLEVCTCCGEQICLDNQGAQVSLLTSKQRFPGHKCARVSVIVRNVPCACSLG